MLNHCFCIPLLEPFDTYFLFWFILVGFAVASFLGFWFRLGFLADLVLLFFLLLLLFAYLVWF